MCSLAAALLSHFQHQKERNDAIRKRTRLPFREEVVRHLCLRIYRAVVEKNQIENVFCPYNNVGFFLFVCFSLVISLMTP